MQLTGIVPGGFRHDRLPENKVCKGRAAHRLAFAHEMQDSSIFKDALDKPSRRWHPRVSFRVSRASFTRDTDRREAGVYPKARRSIEKKPRQTRVHRGRWRGRNADQFRPSMPRRCDRSSASVLTRADSTLRSRSVSFS